MPQMAPILWLYLLLIMIIIIHLQKTILYFFFNKTAKMNINSQLNFNNLNWMW